MRFLIHCLPLFLLTAACVSKPLMEESPAPFGKDGCLESPLVGLWEAQFPEGERITFNQDCTAVSVKCQSRFLFPPNATKVGIVNLKVLESDGPKGCLKSGTYRCSVSLMTNSGTISCEGTTLQIKRL
ncbi:MAG: hypothetical protein FJY29_03285 [Betaproteobacteria bacterium]|nr:hypothetical protein [Betaproteobacteria bacterium]